VVLAQEEIVGDADKAEAELTVAPRLIARLDWRGRVLTGDARFRQRTLCGQVCAAEGERERSEPIVIVEENQPQMHRDLATLFASRADAALAAASLPAWEMRASVSEERGHGRHGQRRLTASTDATRWSACCIGRDGAPSPNASVTTAAIRTKPSLYSVSRSSRMHKP
jgi:hypothetical protein